MTAHTRFSRRFSRILLSTTIFITVSFAPQAFAAITYSTTYAKQDILMGADKVAASANYGAGIKFGVIDTGIVPWLGFSSSYNAMGVNNISTSSGVCLNGTCRTVNPNVTPTDSNGHGTFVAGEIVGGVNSIGMQGVAQAGTVISVQVLGSNGSGTSVDVANGITYAVNQGAMVLNLSLGPSGTGAQQAAFYQSLASSINYAASKGAYIVFAGGNSAQNLANGTNITGFTDAAIQHMLFVGSTNANLQLSSFSNKPGTAGFVSNTGKFYGYSNMWLMADGESLWGASNYKQGNSGYSYITQMSGTSMAAPLATGAIGLLEAKWPILKSNGAALSILEQTATDLGAKDIDSIYGSGFINLVSAFNPVGTLTVNQANGKTVAVSTVTGSMLTSGAFGSLSSISSVLSNYTAFDSFQRNFTVNLSGLLATSSSSSPASQSLTAPKTTTTAKKFADGSSFAFSSSDTDSPIINNFGKSSSDSMNWSMSFTDAAGSTMAAGHGMPGSASFASALWGDDMQVSNAVYSLGASNTLMNLAQGGTFLAYGSQMSGDTRMAVSWSQTQVDETNRSDWTKPDAKSFGTGITTNLTEYWKAGLTFGLLDEQSGMLGTTYSDSGMLSLGDSHKSMSFGMTSVFSLGDNRDLLFDAAIVRTSGSQASGLITDVSTTYARTFGAALVQHDGLKKGDNLSLSVRAPLRVYSGSANITTSGVDENGFATSGLQRVSLAPSGQEFDLTLGYSAPVSETVSWNMSVNARKDAGNISGQNDADFLVGAKIRF